MTHLKLKHVAPYLPYELKFSANSELYPEPTIEGLVRDIVYWNYHGIKGSYKLESIKPILRPLSELTKRIEVGEEIFVPIVELLKIKHKQWYIEKEDSKYSEIEVELTPNYAKACFKYHAINSIDVWLRNTEEERYWVVEKLLEWHFDCFNLIPQNLAIDINTLGSDGKKNV